MVHGGPQAATGHRVGRLPAQGLFDAAILACAMPPRAFGPAPREERCTRRPVRRRARSAVGPHAARSAPTTSGHAPCAPGAKIEVRSCALGTKGPRPVQPDGDLALDARLGMHGLPVRLVFDLRRACEHGTVAAVGAYGP